MADGIFDELFKAIYAAQKDGNPVVRWRFSPEGWDKVRMQGDMTMLYVSPATSRIEAVLGRPYSIDCDLPPETDFAPVPKHEGRTYTPELPA